LPKQQGGNSTTNSGASQRTYYRQISAGTDRSNRSRSPSPDRSGSNNNNNPCDTTATPSSPSGVVRLSNTSTETTTTASANPTSSTTTAPIAAATNHGSYSSLHHGHSSQSGIAPSSSPSQDKSYAFVEFRSVEEASNCMALDGVRFKDTFLKIRRPNNYDPAVAIMLGPIEPSPALDLSRLDIVRTVVQDSPHKVFIGGLPCDWTEEQVTEMLLPFGTLKAFNLVMDRQTGNSRGYAFCEFNDVSITDSVISTLHGKPIGNKYLTVKRALGPTPF
jgi:splicing factor U2AF subunit